MTPKIQDDNEFPPLSAAISQPTSSMAKKWAGPENLVKKPQPYSVAGKRNFIEGSVIDEDYTNVTTPSNTTESKDSKLNSFERGDNHTCDKKDSENSSDDNTTASNRLSADLEPDNVIKRATETHYRISRDCIEAAVGLKIGYFGDLNEILADHNIGTEKGPDFILTPIEPDTQVLNPIDKFVVVADLGLPSGTWSNQIAINLNSPPLNEFNLNSIKKFERLFQHALYLSAPVIVVACPDNDLAAVTLASIVNESLNEASELPLVLFKVNLGKTMVTPQGNKSDIPEPQQETKDVSPEYWNVSIDDDDSGKSSSFDSWRIWNALKSYLRPDIRFGVCLSIVNDLTSSEDERNKWCGEPVRMITISTNQFVWSCQKTYLPRLSIRTEGFIKKVALANSLKTGFVFESCLEPLQTIPYTKYLTKLYKKIQKEHSDPLREFDDKLRNPLQPLSSNLSSTVYQSFELDTMKYIKYRDAMIKALNHLTYVRKPNKKTLILMVLGAGRGPLVDNFIEAIRGLPQTKYKFKIYALDKNVSSVRSLKFKQTRNWFDETGLFTTEVVECDMRSWKPGVEADIIATELLGSFADNELSPECLGGVWQFSTPSTISIPQQYSSYIAPICSTKLHQELSKLKEINCYAFDQLYVVKLMNIYLIDEPQELFSFEHKDLSETPDKRCNQRYKKLAFNAKVETVCHGFAGYFSADLFDDVTISTCPANKTHRMDSWFPVYIPLEQPVQISCDSTIEIHFFRKESTTQVWYEWVVTGPVRSRIHSPGGRKSAMSKII